MDGFLILYWPLQARDITRTCAWRITYVLSVLRASHGGAYCTCPPRWCSPPLLSSQCTSVAPTSWSLTRKHKDNVLGQPKNVWFQVPKSPVFIQSPRNTQRKSPLHGITKIKNFITFPIMLCEPKLIFLLGEWVPTSFSMKGWRSAKSTCVFWVLAHAQQGNKHRILLRPYLV